MSAVTQARIDRPDNEYFDNYFGRKSNGLFHGLEMQNIETYSYAVQLVAPLSSAAQRYITGNAQWYATVALPYLSQAEHQQWHSDLEIELRMMREELGSHD